MSLSKLHDNGILTGKLDYFCLFCEEPFKCLNKVHDHLKEPDHLRNQEKFEYTMTDLVREDLYKKLRGILNKLTPQNFAKLLDQVKSLEINTEERLFGVIDIFYEKAVEEPNFSEAYASMCVELSTITVPSGKFDQQFVNFRALLINKCQNQFLTSKVSDEVVELEKEISECTDAATKKYLQLQLDEENCKVRMRSVGNVRFIGELYKVKMLNAKIMGYCLTSLVSQIEDEKLECLCVLLTTIGQRVDSEAKEKVDGIIKKMQEILDEKSHKISSRVRFMLQYTIALRKRGWASKNIIDSQPEMQDEFQKEADQKQRNIEIDNNSFQCLTCNSLCPSDTFLSHFESPTHKLAYAKCKISNDPQVVSKAEIAKRYDESYASSETSERTEENTQKETEKSTTESTWKPDKEANAKKAIAKAISEYYVSTVAADHITETANCKECNVNLEFESKSIQEHIKIHKYVPTKAKKAQPKKKKPEKFELQSYCKENNIDYSPAENQLFCRVCESKVPKTDKNIQDHVNGAKHKANVAKSQNTTPVKPFEIVVQKRFLTKLFEIKGVHEHLAIVNYEFCVAFNSFHLLIGVDNKLLCKVCEVYINADNLTVTLHVEGSKHVNAFNKMPVLVSIANEFIREVLPGKFHCAFCNSVESSFNTLQRHLASTAHGMRKRMYEFKAIVAKPGSILC